MVCYVCGFLHESTLYMERVPPFMSFLLRASKKGEVLVAHKLGFYQADGPIPRQHPLNFHLCSEDLSMLDTFQ
jgi:hypothetical protein